MGILSMMQAIQIGIESIEKRGDIPPRTKELAIELLQSLEQADWHRNWDKESIVKALNDFKERTGKAPTTSNLKEYGMPKSITIYSNFHMAPSLLLKRLFPENRKMKHVNPELFSPFGFETEEDWLNCFIEQFNKHKHEDMTCRQYNVLRDEDTPTWSTIARHCGLTTWTELMKKANVEYAKKIKTANKIHIVATTSPTLEKLENLSQRREQLNTELYNILSTKK